MGSEMCIRDRGRPEVDVQIEAILTSADDVAVADLVAVQERSARAWLDAYAVPGEFESTREALSAEASFDAFRDDNADLARHLIDSRAAVRGDIKLLQVAGLTLLAMLTVACAGAGALAAGRVRARRRAPAAAAGGSARSDRRRGHRHRRRRRSAWPAG